VAMLFDKQYISVEVDEAKLKERNRELSLFLEMSNFLATSMGTERLLKGALSRVLEYFELEAGRIYLIDEKGEYLNLVAYHGVQPYHLRRVSISEGFSGKAFRTKSFIAQHVYELEDKQRGELLMKKGFKSIICVPLIAMDEVAGVMNLATGKTIELDQTKIDLLTAMGNQIAVATNNAKLYEELQNRIHTLKEKKEMIKFFAYSVSHDLKSPATGVYGFAKRLREKYGNVLDDKGRGYCDQIMKTAAQMVDLVENINAYITAREVPLNLEKVSVREITETIRNEFSTLMDQRGVRWSEPRVLPEIIADEMALTRVFRNFVDNALKYGGEKVVEIRVGYKEEKRFHIFSISDDGVGVRTKDKRRIFDPFERLDTSKGTPGSGLGLAIVREIAKQHQGHAWMDNGINQGTTFYISISKDLKITDQLRKAGIRKAIPLNHCLAPVDNSFESESVA
jgi:K+-sensing histidine kinase KdpD